MADTTQAGPDLLTAELEAGYAKARGFSDSLGYNGDSYAAYLRKHDQELAAKGRPIRAWPLCLQGNDGD